MKQPMIKIQQRVIELSSFGPSKLALQVIFLRAHQRKHVNTTDIHYAYAHPQIREWNSQRCIHRRLPFPVMRVVLPATKTCNPVAPFCEATNLLHWRDECAGPASRSYKRIGWNVNKVWPPCPHPVRVPKVIIKIEQNNAKYWSWGILATNRAGPSVSWVWNTLKLANVLITERPSSRVKVCGEVTNK